MDTSALQPRFPLKLSDDVQLDEITGFFPVRLGNKSSGFECDQSDTASVVTEASGRDFNHDWKYALRFRWLGSKREEMLTAWMAAIAYARATDGVIFDELDGKVRTADQALEVVRDLECDDQQMIDVAVKEALRRVRSQS